MVATGLVKKGLFEDAIKMFDLAGVSVGSSAFALFHLK